MWKALSAISSAITSGAAALETAARGTEQFAKALENEVDELAKSRAIERKRQMDTLNKELEALETATHAGDKSVKRLENEVSMDAKTRALEHKKQMLRIDKEIEDLQKLLAD